jgi:ribonuclease HI
LQALKLTDSVNPSWDVIIVGDGSGSRWGYPGGWASILFDRRTGLRKTLYGAFSDTTVNICELSPYLYTLQWYVRGPGQDLQREIRQQDQFRHRLIDVHIVTDCDVIAKQGRREWDRDTNAAFWAGIDSFSRLNYQLHWHWFPRDQFASNRLCDALSKEMRYLITSIEQKLDVVRTPDAYDDQYGRLKV